jgi:hypothetical protein
MEKLYRKTVSPSGKVRYVEAFGERWFGDPADGIWYVKKNRYSWISEKLADFEEIKILGNLYQYLDEVIEIIVNNQNTASIHDMAKKILELLSKKISKI